MVGTESKAVKGTARLATGCITLVLANVIAFLPSLSFAATANLEASSPQRVAPARVQPKQPVRNNVPTTNAADDGVPDQSWGGPQNINQAQPSPRAIAVRQVNVPVLGREGPVAASPAVRAAPAAAVRKANVPVLGREGSAAVKPNSPARAPAANPSNAARPIAITASEPPLASAVRSQDVASFQKIGAPYQVGGTWYVPAHEPNYDETGVASWYGTQFQGRPTANGEIFDMNVVSGAHPTLPIPSLVEVTNLSNGRSIVVRVNDRGPFVRDRLIDLSSRGAELLGFKQEGHTNVRVRYVGPANSEPVVTAENISVGRAQVAAAPQVPTGPSFVQVGAFSQLENAQRAAEQANAQGPTRVVQATQADGSTLYRVILGPLADRNDAGVKAQELSLNGFAGARVVAALN